MKSRRILTIALAAGALAVAGGLAISAQDKYAAKVPGGLAFSEFRGFESWEVVSISHDDSVMAATLANPV